MSNIGHVRVLMPDEGLICTTSPFQGLGSATAIRGRSLVDRLDPVRAHKYQKSMSRPAATRTVTAIAAQLSCIFLICPRHRPVPEGRIPTEDVSGLKFALRSRRQSPYCMSSSDMRKEAIGRLLSTLPPTSCGNAEFAKIANGQVTATTSAAISAVLIIVPILAGLSQKGCVFPPYVGCEGNSSRTHGPFGLVGHRQPPSVPGPPA